MTDPDKTARWITEARTGDDRAWDELFLHSAPRLRLFLRVRMGPALKARLEPEDVIQEVYLRAHERLDRFEHRGAGSFVRWLCRLTEHSLLDLADHHGAQKRKAPSPSERLSRVMDRLRDSQTGPLGAAVTRDRQEQLAHAIEGLPTDDREVFVARWFEGRSADEIAERRECSPVTVRRIIGRVLHQLGGLLRDEESER